MAMKKFYKGFKRDMTCRGFQYKEGETYTHDGDVKLCEGGFHACEDAMDCLRYYDPADSEYHEVELDGVSDERGDDSKVVAKRIKIGAKVSLRQIIEASIEYRFSKTHEVTGGRTSQNRGAASATGGRGAASATGGRGAASATGYSGAASATGDSGAASATGGRGAASATGYSGAASATGYSGAASATGDSGAASATGDSGAALVNGDYSAAEVSGKESVAIATGLACIAKGALGCWLVLTERGKWNGETYPIIEVRAVKVDGVTVKPDTFYKLSCGGVKEA